MLDLNSGPLGWKANALTTLSSTSSEDMTICVHRAVPPYLLVDECACFPQ